MTAGPSAPKRVETLALGAWRALIGVRSSLKLLATMTGHDPQPDLDLEVEAWVGEPEESDGIAVIDPGDVGLEVARVPLCECGDRGCGNIGIQLRKRLAGRDLPALVDLLRALSWSELIPARSNVLRGMASPLSRHQARTRPPAVVCSSMSR